MRWILAPIVVIGRNEGERLRRCLLAALRQSGAVVYVDSGSNDGSAVLARSLGIEVVALDATAPYTAARARNAGFEFLVGRSAPSVDAVQFVDGDCELSAGWLQIAEAELARRPEAAAVCGRRRERFPDASILNRLCELEWDTRTGDVASFGGDALIRVAAFRAAGCFRPELIAGEEPELSLRLRREGWKIVRLAAEMTLHDSNILRFGQWWRRTLRSGHAYAEGAWLHGLEPEHHCLRQSLSIWFWGVAWPLLAAGVVSVWPLGALDAGGVSRARPHDLSPYAAARASPPRRAALFRLLCAGKISAGARTASFLCWQTGTAAQRPDRI